MARASDLFGDSITNFFASAVVMEEGNDSELAARCLGGDVDAFASLVGRYERVLFNTALRMVGNYEDARDITQNAFVKAYEKLDSYDPQYRFFSWIYRITINESLNLLHGRKTHQALDSNLGLASSSDPQRELLSQEVSARVQSGLMKLSPDQREVLILRHFLELSYGEMAATLTLPEKTVKSRLYTARQRLADLLGDWSAAG